MKTFRPSNFKEFIGNEKAKTTLKNFVSNFKKVGEPVTNILLTGSPGYGKTTLAECVANELGAFFLYINCSAIKNVLAFRNQFCECQKDGYNVIFLDEAHALPKPVYNSLLSLLEYPYYLCYESRGEIIRERPAGKHFTYLFATTDPQDIPKPILSRLFEIKLEDYSIADYCGIAFNMSTSALSDEAMVMLAKLTRNPRQLAQWINYLEVDTIASGSQFYGIPEIQKMLNIFGYNGEGIRNCEVSILKYLYENHKASVDTIAAFTDIGRVELIKNIEPFLIKKGLLKITAKGRELTGDGRSYVLKLTGTSQEETVEGIKKASVKTIETPIV